MPVVRRLARVPSASFQAVTPPGPPLAISPLVIKATASTSLAAAQECQCVGPLARPGAVLAAEIVAVPAELVGPFGVDDEMDRPQAGGTQAARVAQPGDRRQVELVHEHQHRPARVVRRIRRFAPADVLQDLSATTNAAA